MQPRTSGPSRATSRFGEPVVRLRLRAGVEDRADQRTEQAVLVLASMAQAVAQEWTVQRCELHPRTLAIAAFRPACASLIASWTPTRPRLTGPLRKSVQNAGESAARGVTYSLRAVARRPPVPCVDDGLDAAAETELHQDVRDVGSGGGAADDRRPGDLGVGEPAREDVQDLALAGVSSASSGGGPRWMKALRANSCSASLNVTDITESWTSASRRSASTTALHPRPRAGAGALRGLAVGSLDGAEQLLLPAVRC